MTHTTLTDKNALVSAAHAKSQFSFTELFSRRHDGILVRNATTVRRMMPFLMPGRNEAAVTHEQVFDLRRTLAFLQAYNEKHPDTPLKVFDLIIAALIRVGIERPGMSRFVAGGRLYDRKEHSVSFAVKREKVDYSALRTVKFKVIPNEDFESLVKRLRASINTERSERGARPVEKEVNWFLKLPGVVLAGAVRLVRLLDYFGLFPQFMMKDDPLFSSVFVANIGSLGIDRVQHHLYEYGNIGLFCAVGLVKPEVVVGANRKPEVTDTVHLNWTFDERANDAHYCVESLNRVQHYVENPETLVAPVRVDEVEERLMRDRNDAQVACDVEATRAA